MRPVLVLMCTALAAATLAVAAVGAPAPATTPSTFVLTGGGWGHGVGMSQWGAFGQARAGRTFEEILATYYQGTELGTATITKVRVLVVERTNAVRVESTKPVRVRAANGAVVDLPAGVADVDAKLRLLVGGARTPMRGPLRVLPTGGATLQLGDKRYRGELRLLQVGGSLQVVNALKLEAYLQGVVPGEMPKDWPQEALKAQAVAARTYAVAGLVEGKPFDLYSDWRSQVYYGVDREAPSTTRAVRQTKGTILTFEGKPAQALYFSSSGGRTRSAVDLFGNDLPYLTAVDDPWDDVPENPNHRWKPRVLTGAQLARLLGIGSPVVDVASVGGSQGRPAVLRFTTKAGGVFERRISDLRWQLELLSSSFRLGTLRLARPSAPIATGAKVALAGVARDVDEPQLERRLPGGGWARAATVKPRPDGTFTAVVRPPETTTYRLSAAGLGGPSLTLTVTEAPG